MKKRLAYLFMISLFLFLIACTSHESEPPPPRESVNFDVQKCQIVGNHAYIPLEAGNSLNYAKYVLPAIDVFEGVEEVKVTSFTPQIDASDQTLTGVWVTFDPKDSLLR